MQVLSPVEVGTLATLQRTVSRSNTQSISIAEHLSPLIHPILSYCSYADHCFSCCWHVEPQHFAPGQGDAEEKENGPTIGSRLRKRRRSASPPRDESPVVAKRQSARQETSPDVTRNKLESTPRGINKRPRTTAQDTPLDIPSATGTLATTAIEITPRISQAPVVPRSPTEDFQAVFANIISHGETLESLRASQGYDEMGTVDTASFLPQQANLHLKTQSLPILDNLASTVQ